MDVTKGKREKSYVRAFTCHISKRFHVLEQKVGLDGEEMSCQKQHCKLLLIEAGEKRMEEFRKTGSWTGSRGKGHR